MSNKYIFTSESVFPGHPDKTCDAISDALLDFVLTKDPFARCAFEALVTKDNVIIAGETKINNFTLTVADIEEVVRGILQKIGHESDGFHFRDVEIKNLVHRQSPDIAIGVDEAKGKEEGAGDQGIMFGYACKETEELMPASIHYAHKILQNIWNSGLLKKGLGVDAKSQVSLIYENGIPTGCYSVTVSIQHKEDISLKQVREMIIPMIAISLPKGWMPTEDKIYINPTGRFVIGGPVSDTGLTGRKIIVDTYGGSAPHGGGAFSGKDPTKVDRSAAYMARFIAKNVVDANLAEKCLIQLSYVIGISKPISIYVNTYNTGKVSDYEISEMITKKLDLSPKGIRTLLDLNRPIYLPTASFGHFGRKGFTWEETGVIF
jgi:S-adenosylmethionine synthetase